MPYCLLSRILPDDIAYTIYRKCITEKCVTIAIPELWTSYNILNSIYDTYNKPDISNLTINNGLILSRLSIIQRANTYIKERGMLKYNLHTFIDEYIDLLKKTISIMQTINQNTNNMVLYSCINIKLNILLGMLIT